MTMQMYVRKIQIISEALTEKLQLVYVCPDSLIQIRLSIGKNKHYR